MIILFESTYNMEVKSHNGFVLGYNFFKIKIYFVVSISGGLRHITL